MTHDTSCICSSCRLTPPNLSLFSPSPSPSLLQDKWDPYGVSAAALGGADCYGGKRGAVVEGVSGVLYLEGRGSMAFVDAKTGDLEREFEIIPGRLFVWDNVSLFHKVDVADSSTPRVMLGACMSATLYVLG